MNKIIIDNQEIEFKLRRNKRSKRLRLCLYPDSSIVVTLPLRASESLAENFLREKSAWLLGKLLQIKKRGTSLTPKLGKLDFVNHKKSALSFIEERLSFFNQFYNLKWKKIAVKNQKTRWGSCSRKGNLNFNFRLLFLPRNIADYVIVHELCHLQEFNHSSRFWNLVSRAVPDYSHVRKELRRGTLN